MKIPVLLIIPKGNQVNHLCEVNLLDGSTCFLRAVECTDHKAGLVLLKILEKEKF